MRLSAAPYKSKFPEYQGKKQDSFLYLRRRSSAKKTKKMGKKQGTCASERKR